MFAPHYTMLEARQLWTTAPPEPRSREANWPTVLYSWWCTAFATAIILIRLNGRKVRSGQLFREDWIMIAALAPLWIRMIIVHFVLIYGTNNIQTDGYDFTQTQLYHHSVGARLVLASRIIYALFIWMSKWVVSEFLKRMTISLWRRSYELTLQGIRIFLVVTFVAVVVATLAECQPFDHYWQVIPDPGAQCRQGFAQLLTMGTADIITDILLVVFPIPIVLRSGQPWTRKILLACLFSTSCILILITGFRMPEVIAAQGRQQYRSAWASSEILASTFVANFIIIGSFLRDKGTKRNKYRAMSVAESLERTSTRRPTIVAISQNDSDEDLFRSLGCRVPEHLQDPKDAPRQAPPAIMSSPYSGTTTGESEPLTSHQEAIEHEYRDDSDDESLGKSKRHASPSSPASRPFKQQTSFFDVGGLLEDGNHSEDRSQTSTAVGSSNTAAYDFAPPSPTDTRRGSRAMLADLSAFLSSTGPEPRRGQPSGFGSLAARYRNPPTGIQGPMLSRHDTDVSLQDAGGLLGPSRPSGSGSLQDVGGLLEEDRHDMDASAIALQRRMQQRVGFTAQSQVSPPRSVPSTSSTAVSRGYESMDLQDPGGLLR